MSQATRAVRGSWGLTVGWNSAPPPPGPMMRQRSSPAADAVKARPAASTRIRRVPGMRLIGVHGRTRPDQFARLAEKGAQMVAIHARDDTEVDALGADRLALAVERAGPEALSVRGGHQGAAAARAVGLALWQEAEVGELGPHEERGRAVGAGGHAGAAADARGRVERALGHRARDRERIGLGRAARADRDVAAGAHHAVERAAVHHEVANDREGAGPDGLQGDGGAVAERAHREQARGGAGPGPVRTAVHHDAAGPADALAAVAVEGHRWLAARGQQLVQAVERFEQG